MEADRNKVEDGVFWPSMSISLIPAAVVSLQLMLWGGFSLHGKYLDLVNNKKDIQELSSV